MLVCFGLHRTSQKAVKTESRAEGKLTSSNLQKHAAKDSFILYYSSDALFCKIRSVVHWQFKKSFIPTSAQGSTSGGSLL
jgi:hypothetical protein